MTHVRNLILVFGDQLDQDSAAFDGFDPSQDAVLLMEVNHEATYIRQHKIRLVLFFSAMRHFRDALRAKGWRVHYRELDDPANAGAFEIEIPAWLAALRPARLIALAPGDYRVLETLRHTARLSGVDLEIRDDRSFFCTPAEFARLSSGESKLILENFYRAMRRQHRILLDTKGKPTGGRWNFDAENRHGLSAEGRRHLRPPRSFALDALTRDVVELVRRRFPDSPGRLESFDYPVTPAHARDALLDFAEHRLPWFGPYQDAMALDEPYLFHSRLSSSMNLHLLTPKMVVDAALNAHREGWAALPSVEGFVRQILGWREFVRGVYWRHMPGYADHNALDARLPVPHFFWTGETDMACVRDAVNSLIHHAYTHHIQRLMVLGLYALLLGVQPYAFHQWHMSMYVDAIDWVSLPNALGMSQFGDGGIMGTKPYCASGKYIDRMSDSCRHCRYDPDKALGDDACPFTTLYWDFLARHRDRFSANPRMRYQLLNLNRRDKSELVQIRRCADSIKT